MNSHVRHVGVCAPIGGFGCRRVWPQQVRNIRNIEIYEKETLKKQGVINKNLFRQYRNTVEHTGTTCSPMFRKCSAKPFSPEQPVARTGRGAQRFARKFCSGMFRQWRSEANQAAGHVAIGLTVFLPGARSGCSGGGTPMTHADGD